MAKQFHHLPGPAEAEDGGGLLSRLLADEERLDRQDLWRLGSWGVGAVAAVVVAMLASQSSMALRRDEMAADDLARQAQQIQRLARDNQLEARRLAAAVDTLNGDRDRLYSRVTSLEQGLESVTGSITRQSDLPPGSTNQAKPDPSALAKAPSPDLAIPPAASAVSDKPAQDAKLSQDGKPTRDSKAPDSLPATTASLSATARSMGSPTPLVTAKSIMAPPDPAAGKLIEAAPLAPSDKPPAQTNAVGVPERVPGSRADPQTGAAITPSETPATKTDFAVDLGGANSFAGLRGLWRGLLKANPVLGSLRPMVVVRESNNGLGMQLRLLAGPIINAAAAARLCAALVDGQRTCETTTFEGQHLSLAGDEKAGEKVVPAKPASRRHTGPRRVSQAIGSEPPRQPDAAKKPEQSKLSSFFNRQ